jgi:hypothetical protein
VKIILKKHEDLLAKVMSLEPFSLRKLKSKAVEEPQILKEVMAKVLKTKTNLT